MQEKLEKIYIFRTKQTPVFQSFFSFLRFPECTFDTKEEGTFKDHVIENYPFKNVPYFCLLLHKLTKFQSKIDAARIFCWLCCTVLHNPGFPIIQGLQTTPRESFFQKCHSFWLGQTVWAEFF
jgi:hypothetical protein